MDEETKAAEAKKDAKKADKPPKPELPELPNYPNVSMVDAGREIVLAVEVPGFSRKDLTVGLNINSVALSGKKKPAVSQGKDKALLSELKYGMFNRMIKFSCDVDTRRSRVKAQVKNGMFTMTLRKKDYRKIKTVPVS